MAYRRASLIDLYLHTKFHWNRKHFFLDGLTTGTLQVQGHVTQKLGKSSKIRRIKFRILRSCLRISGHLPAPIVNGGGDRPGKVQVSGLQKPRDLDLDLGSGHTAYRRVSVIDLYLHPKCHWNRKNFVDGCTDGRTNVPNDGWIFPPVMLLGRLGGVDLLKRQ